MQFIDFPTLIIIIVAAVIIFRLRSVLGQRTGFDDPEEYYKNRTEKKQEPETQGSNDNVVKLPTRSGDQTKPKNDPVLDEINKLAKPRTKLNNGLRKIYQADPSFAPGQFVEGANMAYEMIVMAFADGDDKALGNLLSREVFEGFKAAIDERKSRGESVKSEFIGIDSSEISEAKLDEEEARLTVRFESQIMSATYDKSGSVIDGSEGEVVRVKDIWTFARDTRSNDPNWRLVATEAEG